MEQLRKAADDKGLSEADRAAAMKILAKALWNATGDQGAGHTPEVVTEAKKHFTKLIKQKSFVSSNLAESYDRFLNTNPSKIEE